ncbi:hypothetical protein BD324DRAFT_656542 [Kockovaella imperatae]|uniref:DNA repair protein REV1 n=1 Tax=Kockovaella imperatae TaxID=4999 RepID=A0A1Y1UF28_9TREE|nr:hypothetical protein BD324DRAFT_656542 [Kockovaella imperatae]ORX36643.1 hypothetical protein BD324DRAFT_656542 [Kockovaella imperatae]
MSQEGRHRSDEPSSSFPISSPTFWTEAVRAASPLWDQSTQSGKRCLVDVEASEEVVADSGWDESKERLHESKRARSSSPSPTTTLSYLPNRLGPFIQDDPHAYLANPEYAPNAFGDIGDYMRKKEIKVQTQNRDIALASAAEGTPQIFAGLSFYINGNTHPPMEELRKMILQRGGEVRPVLRSKGMVKYIIAPMLTLQKFKLFQNYKVVREGWITESCKEGKLLDWSRWKLQVQGGWEESSRKGLEGFLGGSQAVRTEDLKPQEFEPSNPAPIPKTEDEVDPHAAKTIEPIALASATQSLLRPVRATPIPISPGAIKPESPAKEPVLTKIHKPEGVWEHYYSKDSNVDAARLMKDQEWRLKNTAERGNEGGFIDGYYQNSRLHHLSTWKAELKVLVAAAQKQSEEQSLVKPSTSSLSPYTLSTSTLPRTAQISPVARDKILFHVDFDCFFVSCGIASRPHLKGKPVVVCHSQAGKGASSTSEIASASYEARAKGVQNGMSLGRARALVGNDLQTIPYEFDTYKKFSLAFYTVLMAYADELQAVSVDEALIDVTSAVAARALVPEEAFPPDDTSSSIRRLRDPAVEIAEHIRDEVRKLTDGCEVSIGIAHNILLAKLATRKAKPAGVFHLEPDKIPDFIAPLDVEDFPSIGYSIRRRIEDKFGTSKCGELLQHSQGAFKALLGQKTGEMVYGYLRGIDNKRLEPHKERKSISAEMNYGIRFQNQEQAEICVKDLAAEVSKRMKQVNAKGKLLTLKLLSRHPDAPIEPPKFLGHGWCETYNKSSPIHNKGGSATDDAEILGIEAIKLLRAMRLDPAELRGVGIQITKLDGEKPVEREPGQAVLSFGSKVHTKSEPGTPDREISINKGENLESSPNMIDEPTRQGSSPLAESPSIFHDPRSPSPEHHPARPANPSPPLTRRRSAILNHHNAEAGPSRLQESSDGIDAEFLAALPPELRQEVKRDFGRSRQAARAVEPPAPKPTHAPVPARTKGKNSFAHITKQLRPKTKTQLKASAIADLELYGAWAKNQDSNQASKPTSDAIQQDRQEVVSVVSDEEEDSTIGRYRTSELREIGIDPEVFGELPEDMRDEIVAEERRKVQQRKILHRPADTSRARARATGTGYTRTASLSPSRTSRAGSIPPVGKPLASVSLPAKPTLLTATTLPDVLETVTKWIESREGAPPAAKDAAKVKKYLVKCMDPLSGATGVEIVVEVLRWMRTLISEQWMHSLPGRSGEDDPGSQWWAVWRDFKGEMDQLSINRFGATLRI